MVQCNAVTVSIFGFAVGFGQFLIKTSRFENIKTAVHGWFRFLTVPDFNHVQSKH